MVAIDWYIPISFRTMDNIIPGARYMRLGNSLTELLELQFPADSLVLSGFTLVLCGSIARHDIEGGGPMVTGLPVIRVPEARSFSTATTPTIDILSQVALRVSDRHAEIHLNNERYFDNSIAHGRVQFLLMGTKMVGLRVIDISSDEKKTLASYIEDVARRNVG